jgi:hypothetical protein
VKPATPLPWGTERHPSQDYSFVTSRSAHWVASTANQRESQQDATYIAHACNAYPRLVETVRKTIRFLGADEFAIDREQRKVLDQARALLRELGEVTTCSGK